MLPQKSESRPFPFLRVYEGDTFLRNFQITVGTWVVGREPSADFHVDAPTVSRRHFQLEFGDDGTLFIQDLKSSNGTFLNGKRIAREAVGHGDEVKLGTIRMVIAYRSQPLGEVIQFPKQKTDPHIDLREPLAPTLPLMRETAAKLPAQHFPLTTPQREEKASPPAVVLPQKKSPVGRILQGGALIVTSMAVAYVTTQFAARRPVVVPEAVSTPVIVAAPTMEERPALS